MTASPLSQLAPSRRLLLPAIMIAVMALALSPRVVSSYQQDPEPGFTPPWSAAGSTGVPDESALEDVRLGAASATIRGGVNDATVKLRYNVTGLPPVGEGGPALAMTVLYVDNGNKAQVRAWLKEIDLETGATSTVMMFDSNDFQKSDDVQSRTIFECLVDIDPFENSYYLEVELDKSGSAGTPEIVATQIVATSCF